MTFIRFSPTLTGILCRFSNACFHLPLPAFVTSPLHLQPWNPRSSGRWATIPTPQWYVLSPPLTNVTLTQKEQARLQVLNSLLAEHMTEVDQAATLMGVTTRHTRRILAAYGERGAAVAPGHRGHRPANATPDAVVASVVRLAPTGYAGANHTHLGELLSERDGIDIGRTTLRAYWSTPG